MVPEKNVRGVRVTFGNLRGQVMPLHGICGAPVSPGTNLCERYREIGVPFVRLHRTLSEGTGAYVDISRVFPVFELNENDPENYDFAYTDLLIAAAVESGAQVIYRLGESPDPSGICRHARPPRYVSKWAKIAVQVIRHYNDGWANGFGYGIRYWEIWNEPDRFLADGRCPSFANGSPEQAHALYAAAAAAIKAYNPALQVGGMSFAGCGEMAQAFLTLCGQEKTPLDFLSFHLYTTNPEEAVFAARDFAARATACGYPDLPLFLSEWNYFGLEYPFSVSPWDLAENREGKYGEKAREMFSNLSGCIGASFCSAAMARMQASGVHAACYFDGQPSSRFCGLFDRYGNPQKPYYVFLAFGELYRMGNCVQTQCVGEGMYALAARSSDTDDMGVLLTSFRGGATELFLEGIPTDRVYVAELFLLDGTRDLSLVDTQTLTRERIRFSLAMGKYSVMLIRIRAHAQK